MENNKTAEIMAILSDYYDYMAEGQSDELSEKLELLFQDEIKFLGNALDAEINRRDFFANKAAELEEEIELMNQDKVAIKSAVIFGLKGHTDYEGLPTSELNYLQVLNKLVLSNKGNSDGK